jgi:hypothetical protein
MSCKEFEEYARDCVRLAQQADTPELRDQLLAMAREWMEALMKEDAAEGSPMRHQNADESQRGSGRLAHLI